MEIAVYLHRTKKQQFAVCEKFMVNINLDEFPEDKKTDVDYANKRLRDETIQKAFATKSVQKYGTAYVSFMRPQYEGTEENNGNENIYFDNHDMLFKLREGNSDGRVQDNREDK